MQRRLRTNWRKSIVLDVIKDKEEKVCKDCEYWIQKGNMVEHEALYRYNTAMKDYFKRYKFEGDRLLGMVFACDIKKSLEIKAFFVYSRFIFVFINN